MEIKKVRVTTIEILLSPPETNLLVKQIIQHWLTKNISQLKLQSETKILVALNKIVPRDKSICVEKSLFNFPSCLSERSLHSWMSRNQHRIWYWGGRGKDNYYLLTKWWSIPKFLSQTVVTITRVVAMTQSNLNARQNNITGSVLSEQLINELIHVRKLHFFTNKQ